MTRFELGFYIPQTFEQPRADTARVLREAADMIEAGCWYGALQAPDGEIIGSFSVKGRGTRRTGRGEGCTGSAGPLVPSRRPSKIIKRKPPAKRTD
jgi:hypothetical protein